MPRRPRFASPKRLEIWVERSVFEELREIAIRERKPVAEIVREAIEYYIREKYKRGLEIACVDGAPDFQEELLMQLERYEFEVALQEAERALHNFKRVRKHSLDYYAALSTLQNKISKLVRASRKCPNISKEEAERVKKILEEARRASMERI